jgi:asparaginyl-tRNA synthetase
MNAVLPSDNVSPATVKQILLGDGVGKSVLVQGWVRTVRSSKAGLAFLEVNDGSSLANLQVVAQQALANFEDVSKLPTGASIHVIGVVTESPAEGQSVELYAHSVELVGDSPPDFPLQKKRHSFEYLRTVAHLRPRSNTFGAVARVRNEVSRSIHEYFQDRGYLWVHTPLITSIDAEGAGQMFQVTTMDLENVPRNEGHIDFKQDLFERRAYLAVSGQLEAEIMATALGNVYTFGPTFRAENSNTSRHLSEFWMVEPEIAWCDLNRLQDVAEEFIKHIFASVLARCSEDMAFFNQRIEPGVIEKLEAIVRSEFARISYTEAIDILERSDQSFEFPVSWGIDLQSEHERYLTETTFKRPVIVTGYPCDIKAFYMRRNDDGNTVAAMDVLAPRIGEIIGGSQREERLDQLVESMAMHGIPSDQYWWYLDLRRYGSVPHAGFGLGLERVVQFITGMANIRDVIAFPRAPGLLEF